MRAIYNAEKRLSVVDGCVLHEIPGGSFPSISLEIFVSGRALDAGLAFV